MVWTDISLTRKCTSEVVYELIVTLTLAIHLNLSAGKHTDT